MKPRIGVPATGHEDDRTLLTEWSLESTFEMCSTEAVSMNAPLNRKLRFSDVVYATQATPKSLRLWLQRGLVTIGTRREASGWTEYSFFDVAILALVRKFVDFGINVQMASELANRTLGLFPQCIHQKDSEKITPGVFALPWGNRRLRIYPISGGEHWRIEISDNWNPKPEPANAFLVVDVEALLREAFERAEDSLNEGQEDDD